MATTPAVITPNFSDVVDAQYFIEPIGGPQNPQSYLDRFPDEVYNKSIDSHLVKFMYTLLGPAGIGWLRKNYLDARLQLEEYGVDLFNLDNFYSDPLRFGRILEEVYENDPSGVLTRDQWDTIRAKDAQYRSRALDYVRGLRGGTSPDGIHLVARSGLGHECEVIENYKAIYDSLSDDPLGLVRYGNTNSTEEIIVLPRRELARSEIQRITFDGTVTGGFFRINYRASQTGDLAYNISNSNLQVALGNLVEVGLGNVEVVGGPLPAYSVDIRFKGELANQDVPQLEVTSSLSGTDVDVEIETIQGGIEANDEVAYIPPRDQRYLLEALGYVKPVTTIVSFQPASGKTSRQLWNSLTANSSYTEVLRYVTGRADVPWPTARTPYWIEPSVEHVGHRVKDDRQHNYVGFHNVSSVCAYTEAEVASANNLTNLLANLVPNEHIGAFSRYQSILFGFLSSSANNTKQLTADRSLADYPEPLTITTQIDNTNSSTLFINGIYPAEYQALPNVPPVRYKDEQFWASKERTDGDDYLEIDLGTIQAVNYITFDVSRKPFDIVLDVDGLDLYPMRSFMGVTLSPTLPSTLSVGYTPSSTNPWDTATINFTDINNQMVYTRFLRLKFIRREDSNSPFGGPNNTKLPFSIEVKNLRVGRVVSL